MWWLIWETASNIALGVFGACTVLGCGSIDKPHNATDGGTVRPPIVRPAPAQKRREIVASGSAGSGCFIEARANGEVFPEMLLDTGATGASSLTFGSNDAERLGIDADALKFDRSYSTANGTAKAAFVTLRQFRIGDTFVLRNVRADIMQAPMRVPLVGVELLHRLNLHLKDGKCLLTLPSNESAREQAAQRAMRALSSPAYKPGDRRDMNDLIVNSR